MKKYGQIEVELQDIFGDDRVIASAAWTSSLDYQKKKTRTDEDVKRIVNMLADQKHSVPFENVVLRFWLKIPIQTDRQIVTHRIASHSGLSGRYRTVPNEFYNIPDDVKNITLKGIGDLFERDNIAHDYIKSYDIQCFNANETYKHILEHLKNAEKLNLINNDEYKRCREFYRGMLPQNNMTERVTTINLRSFANFIKLRLDKAAQLEIQIVAKLMLEEVKEKSKCPIAIEALERNKWNI